MYKLVQIGLLAALVASPWASARAQPVPTPAPAKATQPRVPQTAEDHLSLAKKYLEQAAANRALAQEHRTMAVEYAKSVAGPTKSGPNPWAKKMERHCMAIVKDAEALAVDAEKAAEYHTFRAKELQGK